jgi:hypothetical protein
MKKAAMKSAMKKHYAQLSGVACVDCHTVFISPTEQFDGLLTQATDDYDGPCEDCQSLLSGLEITNEPPVRVTN